MCRVARHREGRAKMPFVLLIHWYSNVLEDDTSLVITESGIDALSSHAIHHPAQTRYCSIAGEMNAIQRELLASGIQKLPAGGTVIIATDHDDAGGTTLTR
jgi:hypothetical protein